MNFGNEAWENFWLMHESDISYWGLFTIITEFFFGNGYFWNISLPKNWCGEVCSYLVLELVWPSQIQLTFFCWWYKFGLLDCWTVGQLDTLDCCKSRLNHAGFFEKIETKRQYFYFLRIFIGIIGWKWHWKTLLDTDLDSLLPFKWKWIRLTPE